MDRQGTLHVITGPMFAGKTVRLIDEIGQQRSSGSDVEIFTHAIDDRHRIGDLSTHDGDTLEARAFASADDIVRAVADDAGLVAIDEAQFFGAALVPAVGRLLGSGRDVILAGLCVTFDGQPFDPIPHLMSLADRVDKLVARCHICGEPAPYHQPLEQERLTDPLNIRSEQIGGADIYEARCRRHFTNAPAEGRPSRT